MRELEKLEELVRILSNEGLKKIHILHDQANYTNSKWEKLYHGLRINKYKNRDDAIQDIYGDLSKKSKTNFSKLKKRLEERLMNTLFFINNKKANFTKSQKAYYTCYVQWSMIKILIGRSGRKSAIAISENIIKTAFEYEFTDIILDLSRILRRHYVNSNDRKYHYFDRLVEEYTLINNAEILAETYYERILNQYSNRKLNKIESILNSIKVFSKELQEKSKSISSYKFNLYSNLVFTIQHELMGDTHGLLKVCDIAISKFESDKNKSAAFHFYIKKLNAYIILKDFEAGESTVNRCLDIVNKNGINWFVTLEGYMKLCFHAGNYNSLVEYYIKGSKHKQFKKLHLRQQELWKVYEAYIHFFIAIEKIQISTEQAKNLPTFRLTKFDNDFTVINKDKDGLFISIQVIKILFLLSKRKYGKIFDLKKSLENYIHRHLRKDETLRSLYFYKMLVLMINSQFHKSGTIRRCSRHYNLLLANPISNSLLYGEIEIIPYEELWEIILTHLNDRFAY